MDFQDLGLTANESKAYETSLRLGMTTASHISKESGVPYGRIYTVLATLEEKGLVRTVPEETKKYVASNPDRLHEIVKERIKGLEEMEKKVSELKDIYTKNPQEPVIIAKGKNNFYKITKEEIKAKRYSYSVKYTFEPHPRFLRSSKEHLKKGIEVKDIGRFDDETRNALKIWGKVHKNIKPIQNDGIAMSIQDDIEVMIALIKSNTTMLINDAPFAKLMKVLFLSYYETHDEKGNKINWKK
jgi:sugar-specific transcriptional regulator TrmB